jgi:hypothetical protein
MSNVTLSIDDELLSNSRDYAARRGTSLNGLIRQLLTQATEKPKSTNWFDGYALISEQALGNSKGWIFNRDELYDDRA